MSRTDKIRNQVSESYARAVAEPGSGCCGDAALEGAVPKGVAAKVAGYSDEELAALPAEAVVNSFGCGNPVAFTAIGEGEVVLDLGSGAGIDLLLAAKKVGPRGRVIGVDMTDEMIAKAEQSIAAAGVANVEVRKGVIEELPVESGSVDWVISNCVINLSPEKPKVFAEIARVLKPGGRMLVSDIVVQDLPQWVRDSAALYSSCIAGAISESEYAAGLEGAGLERVEVHERLIYEAGQLRSLVDSELATEAASCCGGEALEELASKASETLEGKIWSARFSAVKPV